ncbi:MAG: GTP 3',8-cyclase MoaA [Sideroxydans sp.]|jgi:cyclic pyranopterin phosphate synthase
MYGAKIIPIVAALQNSKTIHASAWDASLFDSQLTDRLGRPLRDLRVSVTDRCNLRCPYCMPRETFNERHPFLARTELLSFEEIERIARTFVRLGVQKIRLTGGEPLLRKGVEQLVERLARLQTREGKPVELALTTNGVSLSGKAQALRDAGLSRITVSLDGLSEQTFQAMSDSNVSVASVLAGIAAAQRAGFESVKVNMVVKRHTNEHEILPMSAHFRHSGVILRFIEYMDVGNANGWRMQDVVTASEILERVASLHAIEALPSRYDGEVAARWRYSDGSGEIGVIASVTQAFCDGCTRMRLSTDGKLYNCLFASEASADLRRVLRQGAGDEELAEVIGSSWMRRDDQYSQLRHQSPVGNQKIEMSYIGG